MKKINLFNTLLIALSFFLAFFLPFKLFLFSYAVLGPLHYLTEINWLKNKNFFTDKKKLWLTSCIILASIIAIPLFFKIPLIKTFFKHSFTENLINWLSRYTNIAIFSSLFIALILSFKTSYKNFFIYSFLGLLLGLLLTYFDYFNLWVGLFLPTVIHVYIFTILFMLYGNLKDKDNIGYVNIFLLVLTPLIICFIEVKPYGFSNYIFKTYIDNNFYVLNIKISEFLNLSDGKSFDFSNALVLKIQMFISFAYTYHYLNWFSKTTLIGWYKNTTTKQLFILAAIWLFSLTLYFYDYRKGLIFLFFLSYMHVFLEFPLNIISIKGIIKNLFKK